MFLLVIVTFRVYAWLGWVGLVFFLVVLVSLYFTFLLKNFRQYFFAHSNTNNLFCLVVFVVPFWVPFRWFHSSLSTKAIFSLQLTGLLVCFLLFCTNGTFFFCVRSKQTAYFAFKNTNAKISSSQKHCWMWPKFYERWRVRAHTYNDGILPSILATV